MTGIGGARPCALKVEFKVLHELILTRANERTARWPLPRLFGAPPPRRRLLSLPCAASPAAPCARSLRPLPAHRGPFGVAVALLAPVSVV
jgi:hypothetical protein